MPLTYGIDDESEELSIDVVQLNNIVLALRPLIKKARVLVLRELVSCIKRQKLKQIRTPEEKKKRLGRKIVNKLAEIRLLRRMSNTKLCKLVLANVNAHDLLEKGGECLTKQDRIVIRLAARPEVAEFISNFRTKHSDWTTLVQYLLYKNTSGKWKTPEQKRKGTKRRKGDLPFPLFDKADIMDNQSASSIQQFKEYKDKNDRELIAAQRQLLREEAEEGRKVEVEEDSKSGKALGVSYDNPEMKAFINELIAKMDSGEDIDEYLVPASGAGGDKLPVEPKKTGVQEGSTLRMDAAIGLVRGREKVKKPEKQPKKIAVNLNSAEKATPEPRNSSRKRVDKTKGHKAAISPSFTKVSADGVVHEIIVEEIDEDSFNQEDADSILGQDDVEMKKEIRERKEKPESGATHRRAGQQRQGKFRRCRRGSTSKHPMADTTKAPLHPSWAAKLEQRALLSLRKKASSGGTHIVFNDE